MFGSSKSARALNPVTPNRSLTGLERAKLERNTHGEETAGPALPPNPPQEPVPVMTLEPKAAAPAPVKTAAAPKPQPAPGSEAHLHAGPGVKLKGEINGCDTLRVEGIVDGTATARHLIVCPGGIFLGTADSEDAEVEGRFEGTLNVRGKLILRSKGRIAGTLSYGEIEIERGGELAGQVTPHGNLDASRPKPQAAGPTAAAPAPRPQAAAPQPPRPAPAAAPAPAAPAEATADASAKGRKVLFFKGGQ